MSIGHLPRLTEKVRSFSLVRTQFMIELCSLQVPYMFPVEHIPKLTKVIITEGKKRGLLFKEEDAYTFVEKQWKESEVLHLVDFEIFKQDTLDTLSGPDVKRIIRTLKRNIRRLVKRRGKEETRAYLLRLTLEYPDYAEIFRRSMEEIDRESR